MPDDPSPPVAGTSPHLRGAIDRCRMLRARGCDAAALRAELVAYLVVLRPGLPRVLAHEQAEAVIAACDPASPPGPAHPPRVLLAALARPAQPEAFSPAARTPAPAPSNR